MLPADPKPGLYLFYGEDEYRAERALAVIRRHVSDDPALGDLNTAVVEAKDLRPEQLAELVAAWPAFAPHRLVVVKGLALSLEPKSSGGGPARKLTKVEQERARRFIAAIAGRNEQTYLVLLDPAKLGRRKTEPNPIFELAAAKGTVVQFNELRDEAFDEWVRGHAGGRIGAGAIALLEQRVGPQLRLLQSELDKLRAYAGDREITEKDVRLLVSESRLETVFELVDAVSRGQTPRALKLVHGLLAAGEPPMLIIALLLRQYRGLLKVFDRAARGASDYEAVQGTGLPTWKARELVATARALGRARLHHGIQTLHDIDLAIKRGELREGFATELLVLRLTTRAATRRP